GISRVLDKKLIQYARPAIEWRQPVETTFPIQNTDRSVGAMLSHEISKIHGREGLPEGTIRFRFRGSAGQSFGAFAAPGIEFTLEGEANDYFGKGLSGATLIAVPDREATFEPDKNILIGNVALYGATSGRVFLKGMAGERFAVRNSGAWAVVEGTGDHTCEYMTGGRVVVLGETGRNFGAGMSGGIAYVWDREKTFSSKANTEMADLEPLDEHDVEVVRQMIRDHFKYTASKRALAILENWETALPDFVKVMPRDYKRILEQQAHSKKSNEQPARQSMR
ncbi:MAG: glutamate synthase subunit alpha, partial [Bacteroidetes bacterium]